MGHASGTNLAGKMFPNGVRDYPKVDSEHFRRRDSNTLTPPNTTIVDSSARTGFTPPDFSHLYSNGRDHDLCYSKPTAEYASSTAKRRNSVPQQEAPLESHRNKQMLLKPHSRKVSTPTNPTFDIPKLKPPPRPPKPQQVNLPIKPKPQPLAMPIQKPTSNKRMDEIDSSRHQTHALLSSHVLSVSLSSLPSFNAPSPPLQRRPDLNDEYLQPQLTLPTSGCRNEPKKSSNLTQPRQLRKKVLSHQHSSSESSNHSYRSPHFLLRRRNLIAVSVVSCLLSLLSISVLVLTVINPFTYPWQSRTFKENEFTACVKCVYLMQFTTDNNADLRRLYNVNRDGQMYCCAKTSVEISNLLKLIVRQQDYKHQPEIRVPEDITPVAHKRLSYSNMTTSAVPDGHFVMRVMQDKQHNFYNRSVSVKSNSLGIEVSGWYYVYSNIFYRTRCDQTLKFKTLEHNILLISPRVPVRGGSLVKTSYTCCMDCKISDHQSSFTGGVFELFEGDQIFTSVTNVNAVNFDQSPYLGVVMIGE